MMTKTDRYIGRLPKIGIRPTIDGRRNGVRESLEETTMQMAKAVAAYLSSELKHYNGEPVECVIADTCIGGVAEAARAADKFAQEGVGVSITVTPCWCYGSETMDMDPHLPKAVWGFNGTERPGAVYLAAVLAGHNQKGLPAFGIYGQDVQDAGDETIPEDVKGKLLRFAKSGLAVAMLKGKSYLSMGSVCMGIAGSMVQEDFFQSYLGMRNEYIDMSEFVRRFDLELYDRVEYEKAYKWAKENLHVGADNNKENFKRSEELKESDWQRSVKMTLIARDLMVGNDKLTELGFEEEAQGHNALIAGFQGQRQWTDHFPNGDFMEAILNSSFDWNGKRAPYLLATENDSLNGVTMAMGHLLTNTAQVFADVRTYWSPDAVKRVTGKELTGKAENGILHLINSGAAALDGTGQQMKEGQPAMKPHWEITDEEVKACLDHTQWRPASTEYFRGGGYSSNFKTKGDMPVTIARLNIVHGLGPVLQIAEGYTVELEDDVHDALDKRTDPTWPTTWFAPKLTGQGAFKDTYSVMNNWGANHCVVSYGHIGDDLITMASILRIPVNMHNVEAERIFRPSAWNMFGTAEAEAADYRACQTFGPLYK
ncbi:L-fucose isomerase [Sporosarcina sp. FSL K6-1522]|uniref:L-fucose isomerase n=2 Tax=Sporosarcina sp. FSL K6-1522 TaxID=2921554 RepID=UPI00315B3F5A